MKRLLLIGGLFLLSAPSWGAFSYYRTITVNHSSVTADQSNFPVVISTTNISLSTITASGGHVANSSGFDIAFSTKDNLCSYLLNWDTETYNASTGKLIAWVKMPTISSTTDTTLYLCYGDSGVTSYQGVSTKTWDSNFKAVYHLPDGTTLTALDSTNNAQNGTLVSAPTATTGQMDGAGNFVLGLSQYITLPTLGINGTVPYSISFWTNPAAGAALQEPISFAGVEIVRNYPVSGDLTYFNGAAVEMTTTYPASGSYHYVVFTSSTSVVNFYVDGALSSSVGYPSSVTDATYAIGRSGPQSQYPYDGTMDEVRFSSIDRSADWLATEYNNQSSPSTFYTIGSETAIPAGATPGSPDGLEIQGGKFVIQGGMVTIR